MGQGVILAECEMGVLRTSAASDELGVNTMKTCMQVNGSLERHKERCH